MLTIEKIKQLADGHGLVDIFGYCYHKEADGIMCHETDTLLKWAHISPILLDNLTIIQQTESHRKGLKKPFKSGIIIIDKRKG